MPDFVIIGAQRCGTTSLYNYLVASCNVLPAFRKEVHFFDKRFARGLLWYQAYFPPRRTTQSTSEPRGKFAVGEATPYYLFHPHAAQRVRNTIPEVKLIVLLRNPIDRALSHYHYEVQRGIETLSFPDAIDREEQRLAGEVEKILDDPHYVSFAHQHFSYLARGIYVEQLRRWTALFPRQRILILKSEELFRHPAHTTKQVAEFLGLAYHETAIAKKYNEASYPGMDPALRRRLSAYFTSHNQALQADLDMDLEWE
ncbi:MAG: sulfotransferase domain-containing protein [Anaerolineae bacterium]|nr:sulfotransferase domain-containing protein [Anaerolineae bacterium]